MSRIKVHTDLGSHVAAIYSDGGYLDAFVPLSEFPKGGALSYLATPYSKYKGGDIELAFREASTLAGRLMRAGVKVYSPIAHTHPLAIYGKIDPLDHSIWLPFDQAMMDVCQVLIVAHMEGWQESKGVLHEIDYFEHAGKVIFDLDPANLTMAKRRKVAA